MKSLILISSYLLKDIFRRWVESPISPLARVSVTMILVTIAMVGLSVFQSIEAELRRKIEAHGLDNIYLIENVTAVDASRLLAIEGDETEWLTTLGSVRRLKTVGASVHTLDGSRAIPCCYDKTLLGEIVPQLKPGEWAAYVNDELPVGLDVRYRLSLEQEDVYGKAQNIRLPGIHAAMPSQGNLLLLPIEMVRPFLSQGFGSYTRLKLDAPEDVQQTVESLNAWFTLEDRSVRIVDSATMLTELDEVVSRQRFLRVSIVLMLSAISFLVIGTIAILELRMNVRVFALIASFGISRHAVFVAFLVENLLLVNFAAAAGIGAAFYLEGTFNGMMDAPIHFLPGGLVQRLTSDGFYFVCLAVNSGALASAVLVRFGLKKDVGRLLS